MKIKVVLELDGDLNDDYANMTFEEIKKQMLKESAGYPIAKVISIDEIPDDWEDTLSIPKPVECKDLV